MKRLSIILVAIYMAFAMPIEAKASDSTTSNTSENPVQEARWGQRGDWTFQGEVLVSFPALDPDSSIGVGGGAQVGIFFLNNISLMTGLSASGTYTSSTIKVDKYETISTSTDTTHLSIPITLTAVIPFATSSGLGIYTGPRFNFLVGYKSKSGEETTTLSDLKENENFKSTSTGWSFGAYIKLGAFRVIAEYQGPLSEGTKFKDGSVSVGLGFSF